MMQELPRLTGLKSSFLELNYLRPSIEVFATSKYPFRFSHADLMASSIPTTSSRLFASTILPLTRSPTVIAKLMREAIECPIARIMPPLDRMQPRHAVALAPRRNHFLGKTVVRNKFLFIGRNYSLGVN